MNFARSAVLISLLSITLSPVVACSPALEDTAPEPRDNAPAAHPGSDPFDVPIDGASREDVRAFFEGDALFGAPLRDADGVGPLYVRSACGACHERGGRGPGSVTKMAVVEADGITASDDQSLLPWGQSVHPLMTAGATIPILPPDDPRIRISLRVGPPIVGRGYLEAVDEAEILRVAAEQAQRHDGIHGRVNHVVYRSESNPDARFNPHRNGDIVVGRFGFKAKIATLDEFTADALQSDMGITSPLRPDELPNPDGLTDDGKPGVDVTAESVNQRATYMRLTAIPRREIDDDGAALFARAKCAVCHVPSLRTRRDYPLSLIADIDAPVFTDLLIHDMGDDLADGITEGEAGSRDFRTAPLIGLRFDSTFLHDGRARTVEQAIEMHGGEARVSKDLFSALSEDERRALLSFVEAL